MLASAASTIGDTWNGRLSDSTQCVAPQPSTENVRLSPPRLAPVDLTQGTVLVVVEDAILAFDLQRLLREVGYRVVGRAIMRLLGLSSAPVGVARRPDGSRPGG